MKKHNPMERLDDRLKALYPNSEKKTHIPKDTALGNFNSAVGDVLKKGNDVVAKAIRKEINDAIAEAVPKKINGAAIKNVLEEENDIHDIMTKVREHATNIHSVQLAKIRDNLKAITVHYTKNRAEWEKVAEQLDSDFEPLIAARQEKKLMPQTKKKKKSTRFTM